MSDDRPFEEVLSKSKNKKLCQKHKGSEARTYNLRGGLTSVA